MLAVVHLGIQPFSLPGPSTSATHGQKRPRGLWKGRRDSPASRPAQLPQPDTDLSEDIDDDADDDDDARSHSSGSSKRRRYSGPDFSAPSCSPLPSYSPLPAHSPLPRLSPVPSRPHTPYEYSSPLAMPSSRKGKEPQIDYEDWENLKELHARALDRYDCDDTDKALPLLRAVIRECTRFLSVHRDPSVIFSESTQRHSRSPEAMTPPEERFIRDWEHDPRPRGPHRDLPTAFHALFGTALFLIGTILAAAPDHALSGEPSDASSYWLAALDVFETGENLPSRTSGIAAHDLEDWRMSIVWGRALVALADEKVAHSIALAKSAASSSADQYCYLPVQSPFSAAEPKWPAGSPFAAIAAARPPVSRRALLHAASAHELLVLAMDQFSRGIFHMPHAHYPTSHNPPSASSFVYSPASESPRGHMHRSPSASSTSAAQDPTFSRPKELFTLASEVLGVAERLPSSSQRAHWATWADSVFRQMRMEAELGAWRTPINAARGRCWLIVGEAAAESVEEALDAGRGPDALASPDADEARDGLGTAIQFFDRAKGAAPAGEDVSPLLAEALLTLANITVDANKREELYARAQSEAGAQLARDLGLDLERRLDANAMDES